MRHSLLLFSDTVQFHSNQMIIWGTVLSLEEIPPFLYSSLHHQGYLRVNYIDHCGKISEAACETTLVTFCTGRYQYLMLQ